MSKLTITSEVAEMICWGDSNEYEIVDEGDWIADYKYEMCEHIFKDLTTDKTYSISFSRSGSYFTDWYYCWEDQDTYVCDEVAKYEKVITAWKVVDQLFLNFTYNFVLN